MNRSRDPLVGWVLDGRYEVTSRIARGGMATVYLATDTRLDREVAVKVMHPHLADDDAFVARFIREAKSAARISHPNVVAVYDQGHDGDNVYLVMEHVRGTTLRDVLNEVTAFTPGQALDVLLPVLSALAAAHRVGLVHRDMKPENVLLADDAWDGGLDDIGHGVKVADFGLARAASTGSTATTGVLIGTAAYLSPELVSRGVADARSDVYASGIMLFEMLVGRPPFEGDVPVQVAFQHVNDEVPLPSDLDEGLPEELDELVDAATARDPDERPRDAAEFARRVRAVRSSLTEGELDREPQALPVAAPVPAQHSTKVVEGPTRGRGQRGETPGTEEGRNRPPSRFPAGPSDPGSSTRATGPLPTYQEPPRRRGRLGPALIAMFLVLAILGGLGGWYFTAGPGAYTTTPVVSGSQSEVTTALEGAGFATEVLQVYDETVPNGAVVGTDPAAGEQIRKNAGITVLVSKGTAFFTMPEIAGETLAEATRALSAEELQVKDEPVSAYSDSVASGSVISTLPKAGQRVERGSEVTPVVSAGPAPVTVPDVRGKTIAEVTATLKELGLRVETTQQFSDTVERNEVISQSVVGEGKLRRGGEISLVVSRGPELVSVPDVVGKQAEVARRALTAAGFKVAEEEVLGGYFGTVRSQSPAGAAKAKVGSTVTITIV